MYFSVGHNKQHFEKMNTGKISGVQNKFVSKLSFRSKLVFIIYFKHLCFDHKDSKTKS